MVDSNSQAKRISEAALEEELEKIRANFVSTALSSQRELVERMGAAMEKVRTDEKSRSGICQEILERLHEEIARGLIAKRTIIALCKEEWKNPDNVKSGRKGAENKKKLAAESAAVPTEPMQEISVTNSGSTVTEPPEEPKPAHSITIREEKEPAEPEPKQLEFTFTVRFEDVQSAMQQAFQDGEDQILFGGVVDVTSGRVLNRWIGGRD